MTSVKSTHAATRLAADAMTSLNFRAIYGGQLIPQLIGKHGCIQNCKSCLYGECHAAKMMLHFNVSGF